MKYYSKKDTFHLFIIHEVDTSTPHSKLYTGSPGLDLGTRQSSGLVSTSTMSGPMRLMQFQGMIKSSFRPTTPKKRQGQGTTMAQTRPSGTSGGLPRRCAPRNDSVFCYAKQQFILPRSVFRQAYFYCDNSITMLY